MVDNYFMVHMVFWLFLHGSDKTGVLDFMVKIPLLSFADLAQVRRSETLERKIERILHGERDSIPIHYPLIRYGIKRYCFTGFHPDVLDALQTRVADYVPTTEFERGEKTNCLMAIGLALSMPRPAFPNIIFDRGETIDLNIGGIILHVVTDATLSWTDVDGVVHVGAIKTKIKKGNYSRESAEMVACLLEEAMRVMHPDAVVDPQLCLCYDVFRQRLVPAFNLSQNLERAQRVAEMIASRGDLAA